MLYYIFAIDFDNVVRRIGRWLSRDPIGEGGGVNLYGFVVNCPSTLVDLLGNATVSIPSGLIPTSPVPGAPRGGSEEDNSYEDQKFFGAAYLREIGDKIEALASNPDCGGCSNACLEKARKIARSLKETWNNTYNAKWRPNPPQPKAKFEDERCSGFYCYRWAESFMKVIEAIDNTTPKCFHVSYIEMRNPNGTIRWQTQNADGSKTTHEVIPVHWAVELCLGDGSKKQCCIRIDDGFLAARGTGDTVHDAASWPAKNNDYQPIKAPHLVRGVPVGDGAGFPPPKIVP